MDEKSEVSFLDSSTATALQISAAHFPRTEPRAKSGFLRFKAVFILAIAIPCFMACSGGDSSGEDGRQNNLGFDDPKAQPDSGAGSLGSVDKTQDASVASSDTTDPSTEESDDDALGSGGVSGEDSDSGTGLNAETVCSKVAAASCKRINACASFGVKAMYGSTAQCAERGKVTCLAGLKFSGSSITIEKMNACIAEVADAECSSLSVGNACKFGPGTLPSGAKCIDSTQCVSEFCARSPTSQCGTCAKPTSVGGACVNKTCSIGQYCTTANKCVAPTKKLGESCSFLEECELAKGFACDIMMTRKCIAIKVGAETCGVDTAQKSFAVCSGNGYCEKNKCKPAVKDGVACSSTTNCMPPALCIGGTCTIPSDATCQ